MHNVMIDIYITIYLINFNSQLSLMTKITTIVILNILKQINVGSLNYPINIRNSTAESFQI